MSKPDVNILVVTKSFSIPMIFKVKSPSYYNYSIIKNKKIIRNKIKRKQSSNLCHHNPLKIVLDLNMSP